LASDASEIDFQSFLSKAPLALVILVGPDHRYSFASETYESMVGRKVIGKTVLEAFHRHEVADFLVQLDEVYQTGMPYVGKERKLSLPDDSGRIQDRFINVAYYPTRDPKGDIAGIIAIHTDVTDEVRAREAIVQAKLAVDNERANFRNLFRQTPEMVCILRGPDHVFEFVNEAHIRALGFDATGMAVRVAQPESVEVHGLLDDVYRTGVTAELHEIPVTLTDRVRYFNLTYAARRDPDGTICGVMILGTEVTSEVDSRQKIREREAYFRELVDAAPAVIWITDPQGNCSYLSRRWYELTGGTPDSDLGTGWVKQIHPEDRDEAGKIFFAGVNSRSPLTMRYRLKHKNGQYRWAVDSGQPRFSDRGDFLGHVGTVVDIHEQISSEGELAILQQRFQNSVAATRLGVWYCDLPFDELIWNKETKEHFFIAPDEPVHIDDFYSRMHPEDRQRTQEAIQRSIDTHGPYDIDYRTVNPKDPSEIKWIRAIGWTDYDSAGRPIRFDGITLDITPRKAAAKGTSAGQRRS
jgi:PAS domain S-box-containing protein